MAYFPNGTAGMMYVDRYCSNCSKYAAIMAEATLSRIGPKAEARG